MKRITHHKETSFLILSMNVSEKKFLYIEYSIYDDSNVGPRKVNHTNAEIVEEVVSSWLVILLIK